MAFSAPDSEMILASFIEMVRIDSPSGGEELLCEHLQKRLKALGLASVVDSGGNLIVDVPANRCLHSQRLLISAHMDVVPPCHGIKPSVSGEGLERLVVSDNTTVLGADDKAAIAPIIEALAYSLAHDTARPALRIVFTTREEVGLNGAKELDDKVLSECDFAVTFDHARPQGAIIQCAPSYVAFEIECLGKSVHAGIMPEKGVNAIVYAAKVLDQLHLGRVNEQTTANIGFFKGGKGTNIVPYHARISGEIRSHDEAMLQTELQHIQGVLAKEKALMPGSDFTFKHYHDFHRYEVDVSSKPLKRIVEAAERSELVPTFNKTNGGRDNNVFMHRGLNGIVMGASFIEPHSLKERVLVREMASCGRFIIQIWECFAREPF